MYYLNWVKKEKEEKSMKNVKPLVEQLKEIK